MKHVHTRHTGIGGIYRDDVKSVISLQDVNGGGIVQVLGDPAIQSRGTVSFHDTAGLEVGDLIHLKNTSPNAYVPATLDDTQYAYAMRGPIGFVSSITPNTSITVDGLPVGFPLEQDLVLEATTWRNDT